jgi:hypothetical protein
MGGGQHVIIRQRVPGSVRADRAFHNTWVFLMEPRVVADVVYISEAICASVSMDNSECWFTLWWKIDTAWLYIVSVMQFQHFYFII